MQAISDAHYCSTSHPDCRALNPPDLPRCEIQVIGIIKRKTCLPNCHKLRIRGESSWCSSVLGLAPFCRRDSGTWPAGQLTAQGWKVGVELVWPGLDGSCA